MQKRNRYSWRSQYAWQDYAKNESFVTTSKGGYVEITLNYPHTEKFINGSSDTQKMYYMKIWNYLKNFAPLLVSETRYVFEYTRKGAVHLHGYIIFNDDMTYYPVGAICDIAKRIHNCLPTKYKHFNENNVDSFYMRYQTPAMSVKIGESLCEWIKYIDKYQNIDYQKEKEANALSAFSENDE